jgi:iron complex outermembrane receptor protein
MSFSENGAILKFIVAPFYLFCISFLSCFTAFSQEKVEVLEEVVVYDKFNKITKALNKTILTNRDLEDLSSLPFGEVLKHINGVSTLNTGNTISKPVIHGLHSSRVAVINNGVRIEDQEWGVEHEPSLDINSVDQIFVLTGADKLEYSGNSLGGVVVTLPKAVRKSLGFSGKTLFTASSNGRGGSLASKFENRFSSDWFANLNWTIKKFGDFETPDYILSNTGYGENNVSLRTGKNNVNSGIEFYYSFFNKNVGILKASHLHTGEDQYRGINSPVPLKISDFTYAIDAPKQEVQHHVAKIDFYTNLTKLGKLDVSYNYQLNRRFEYDIRRSSTNKKPSIDLTLDTHVINFKLTSNISSKLNTKFGLESKFQENFANPDTGIRRIIPDYTKYDLTAYAIGNLAVKENFLFELGFRYDYTHIDAYKYYRKSLWEARNYDELYADIAIREVSSQILANPKFNFGNLSFSIGSYFSLGRHHDLYINYALLARNPNPSELFSEGLHHAAARIEIGDLSLRSEIGRNIQLSYKYKSNTFQASFSPYLNDIENFIYIIPTGSRATIRGTFPVWEYKQNNAVLYGFDYDLNLDISEKLSFNQKISVTKGFEKISNKALIDIPPLSIKNEVTLHVPKYKDLELTLESEYVSRQNQFPDNNFDLYIPRTDTFVLLDLSSPPPAFHLLHLKSSLNLNEKTKIGLRINNLLNESYRNYLNRMRYYADDLGINFSLFLNKRF